MRPLGPLPPQRESRPPRHWLRRAAQTLGQPALLVVLMALGLTTAAACATVSPYERGDLSRPGMDTSREAGEAGFHAHVNDSREGATGGNTSTGGGCGCN